MFRDKRTLALLFVAPLMVLTLMYFFFNGKTVEPTLGVVGLNDSLIEDLDNAEIDVQIYENGDKKLITEEDLDGLLVLKNGQFYLTLENSDPTVAKALQMKIFQTAALQFQSKLFNSNMTSMLNPDNLLKTNYVYGDGETEFFDVLSPVLIGFFVFFFVFLISGIGLLKERTSGTLERLMATPIRRGEIVTAYLIGFGFFAILQTIIVVLYSISVLDVVVVGSVWNVFLINLLLALVALSFGTLLSTFAASEFQMVQFIPIVVVPQVFFAGIFPLEGMADWIQAVGKVMPIYYAADALKSVVYKGLGLNEIVWDLIALSIFALIFIILNIFALKRYRTL